jgi:hypothetical protein
VFARVEGDIARLVDVSIGGLQFEIDRENRCPRGSRSTSSHPISHSTRISSGKRFAAIGGLRHGARGATRRRCTLGRAHGRFPAA